MLESKEKKYILFTLIFALALFVVIIPLWQKNGFSNVNPLIQFALFNLGTLFVLQVFFKSLSKESKNSGSIGTLLLFMGLDILQPPYLIGTNGQLFSGALLGMSSADYVAGYLWNLIGISGYYLYLVTYILTPLILFLIAGKLIKNFVKAL